MGTYLPPSLGTTTGNNAAPFGIGRAEAGATDHAPGTENPKPKGCRMKQARIITLAQLTAARVGDEVAEFWNVLTDDYYTGELIPGSRRVPLDRVGREASELPKDTPIVVYCSGLACPQSGSAGEKLSALGFSNVRVFEGGLEAWKEAGRPVEKDTRAAA